MKKLFVTLFVVSIANLKNLKYHRLVLSVICSKYKNEDKKIFKEEKSVEILKILGLTENIELL